MGKNESISSEIRVKTKVSTLSTFLQYGAESEPKQWGKRKKEN
jgi:hypothetical protein